MKKNTFRSVTNRILSAMLIYATIFTLTACTNTEDAKTGDRLAATHDKFSGLGDTSCNIANREDGIDATHTEFQGAYSGLGNTSCNIANGGAVCEYKNKVYLKKNLYEIYVFPYRGDDYRLEITFESN